MSITARASRLGLAVILMVAGTLVVVVGPVGASDNGPTGVVIDDVDTSAERTNVGSIGPWPGAPTPYNNVDLLVEGSGLVFHPANPDILIGHKDNLGDSKIWFFAADGTGGNTGRTPEAVYWLDGAFAGDYEDIAADDTHVYVWDNHEQGAVGVVGRINRFLPPPVTVGQTPVIGTIPFDEYLVQLESPTGGLTPMGTDIESIAIHKQTGDLIVVEKDHVDRYDDTPENRPIVWRVPDFVNAAPGATVLGEFIGRIAGRSDPSIDPTGAGGSLIAADLSEDGTVLIVKNYKEIMIYYLAEHGDWASRFADLSWAPDPEDVFPFEGSEAIAISRDFTGIYSLKEGVSNKPNSPFLWRYALTTSTPLPPQEGDVVITELVYEPVSGVDGDEFLELHNPNGFAIDLTGWCFTRGIGGCFDGQVIASGGYVVAAKSASQFAATYGFAPDATYTFRLADFGEQIRLKDATGKLVQDLTYGVAAPWPTAPAGGGPSLELIDPALDINDPLSWQASSDPSGSTPRAPNSIDNTPPDAPVIGVVTSTPDSQPGTQIAITADVTDAGSVMLHYVIDFGQETVAAMLDDGASGDGAAGDGVFGAFVPGQAANALVRYRIEAGNVTGTAATPDAADTIDYHGLVVADPALASSMPIVQWFMDPVDYAAALAHKNTDATEPAVLAYDGTVWDSVEIRADGRRWFPKLDWRADFPDGHPFEAAGLLPAPVDGFVLQGSHIDKSHLREVLGWELAAAAGAPSQAAFQVRLDQNGGFFGLYHLAELRDGDWRVRNGVDSGALYETTADSLVVRASEADLHSRHIKHTRTGEDYSDLYDLTVGVNVGGAAAKHDFLFDNLELADVINEMAVMTLIQQSDQGNHNFWLYRDTDGTGRWSLLPWDLDLTFGRHWDGVASRNDLVVADLNLVHQRFTANRLTRAILDDPSTEAMYYRRLRTLMDEHLSGGDLEAHIAALVATISPEATLDLAAWPQYGELQDLATAVQHLTDDFLAPWRVELFTTHRVPGEIPEAQTASPVVLINEVHYHPAPGGVEFVELFNPSTTEAVDLSGWTLDGVELTIAPGTVLPAESYLVFVGDDALFRSQSAAGVHVAGELPGDLDDDGETLTLRDSTGAPVATVTYDDVSPWPSAPDGTGPSVELVLGADPADPASWQASLAAGGSPGGENGSAPINQPPVVATEAPLDADILSGSVIVIIDATDDLDPAGTLVVEVSWDSGATWSAASWNAGTSRYEYVWDTTTLADGPVSLDVRAMDSGVVPAFAFPVSVIVDNVAEAPTVSIDTPPDGSTVSGLTVVSLDATDDIDPVGSLEVEVSTDDGFTWNGASWNAATSRYEYPWDTAPEADGAATVQARATDGTGQPPPPIRLLAAGDIADCSSSGDEETATLINAEPAATVLTLGDNVYPDGSDSDFTSCYDPSWGAFAARTSPSPGNHEDVTPGATGYLNYFGITGDTWYSFDLGDWHLISVDSNCTQIGGCGVGSPVYNWLQSDLGSTSDQCVLVYWHHPRWSSGQHGSAANMDPMWDLLVADGDVELLLVGHDHHYERFAPMDANGNPAASGVRQFVVGTGGKSLRTVDATVPNSEFVVDTHFGVLGLDVSATGYSWEFITTSGVMDSGSEAATCGDIGGSTGTATPVTVTVDNLPDTPVVGIGDPLDGATVTGVVPIAVEALDDIDLAGTLGVEISVDGGPWTVATWSGASQRYELTWDSTSLSEGQHTLVARASDSAANVGTAPPISVEVDNVADNPVVVIATPGDGATVSGVVVIGVDATDDMDPAGSLSVSVTIDGGAPQAAAWNAASSRYEVTWDTVAEADGSHSIAASAIDSDSNPGAASPISVIVDNLADVPAVSIAAPAQGTDVSGVVTVALSASDDIDPVGSLTAEVSVDGGATWATAAWVAGTGRYELSWDTTLSGDGDVSIASRATDSASNTGSGSSVTVMVDNLPDVPMAGITAPTNGSTVSGLVTVAVDASDDVDAVGSLTVQVSIDGGPWTTASWNAGSARYEIGWDSTSGSEGTHSIAARATDAEANTGTATSVTVTVDNIPDGPVVAITSPAGGASVSGVVTIRVDATDDMDPTGSLDVAVTIDGGAPQPASWNAASSRYEMSWNTSGVADGSHAINASATDSQANTGTAPSVPVTVDNVADVPSVSIAAPSAGSTVSGVVTVGVAASDDIDPVGSLTAQVAIAGGPWTNAGWNAASSRYEFAWDTTQNGDGPVTILARATDSQANTGTAAPVLVTVFNTTEVTLISADFDTSTDGFAYFDDPFRGTAAPAYATGTRLAAGGFTGGGLQVVVGGVNDDDIVGMSGGWQRTFNLAQDGVATLTLRYQLSQQSDYETDEFSQSLVSLDGTLLGIPPNDYLAQITGNGNGGSIETTGWQQVQFDLGTLTAGSHTIVIGGYNNKKTLANESSEVLIDDVLLVADTAGPQELLNESFDGGAGPFSYVDDVFRGTNAPGYASGAYLGSGGFTGGGLEVSVGGIDNADIFGMSGGWGASFNVPAAGPVSVSLRYRLTQEADYESDEFSQALLAVDGVLVGIPPNDYLAQITGNGTGGGAETTGWQQIVVDLGALNAGNHTITIGAYNNKKTSAVESSAVAVDDVVVTAGG